MWRRDGGVGGGGGGGEGGGGWGGVGVVQWLGYCATSEGFEAKKNGEHVCSVSISEVLLQQQ